MIYDKIMFQTKKLKMVRETVKKGGANSKLLPFFEEIAHCILPRPVQSDDCVDIDELVEFDLMLCYRNVMDLLIEKGYNSVVFTHPLLYMDKTSVVTLAVTVLTYWMEFSVYAEKVKIF